jgi:hypothetical protein
VKKCLLLAGLLLGGCSTLSNLETIASGSVSANQVYVAANAFDAIEATATNYLQLPPCPTAAPVCRTSSIVAVIVPQVRNGRVARNQLEAYVNANPGQAVPVSNYNVLITTVNTLQGALAAYSATAAK